MRSSFERDVKKPGTTGDLRRAIALMPASTSSRTARSPCILTLGVNPAQADATRLRPAVGALMCAVHPALSVRSANARRGRARPSVLS